MKKFSVILLAAAFMFFPVMGGAAAPKKLRVGLLVDKGSRGNGVFHLASLIAHSPQTELVTLMAQDIRDGKLNTVDVLVVPGGASWRQFYAIGAAHISKVHDFLRKGGSYVGTCAGMTNVTSGRNRMNLLPFVPHRKATGPTAQVTVEITSEGAKILGIKPGRRVVRYSGGPIVYKLPSAKVEGKGDPIAFFKSSVTRPGHDGSKFIGSPAILYGTFGKVTKPPVLSNAWNKKGLSVHPTPAENVKCYNNKKIPKWGFFYLRRPNFLISSSYSATSFFLMYANNFLRRLTINNKPRLECLSL